MPNVKSTKALLKRSEQALEAFHHSYASLWGEERWHDSLFPALSLHTRYCALMNRYGDLKEIYDILDESEAYEGAASLTELTLPFAPDDTDGKVEIESPVALTKSIKDASAFPGPSRVTSSEPGSDLLSHWNLDGASVLAASMLRVEPGDRVLDLCAAPGGKSIVLAQSLWPDLYADQSLLAEKTPKTDNNGDDRSVLHSNEFDKTRNNRLASNLKAYLPEQLFADNLVKVLQLDGSEKSAVNELPLGEGGYDKVLVDAPCSSERHIIHAHLKANSAGQIAEEMANWKASHSKTLAKTQLALLMTALKAVRVGGTVLYATCSISHEENDGVVDRLIDAVKRERKKAPDRSLEWKVKIDTSFEREAKTKSVVEDMTESTMHGRIALPDHPAGGKWGPLYFCVLTKVMPKENVAKVVDS